MNPILRDDPLITRYTGASQRTNSDSVNKLSRSSPRSSHRSLWRNAFVFASKSVTWRRAPSDRLRWCAVVRVRFSSKFSHASRHQENARSAVGWTFLRAIACRHAQAQIVSRPFCPLRLAGWTFMAPQDGEDSRRWEACLHVRVFFFELDLECGRGSIVFR